MVAWRPKSSKQAILNTTMYRFLLIASFPLLLGAGCLTTPEVVRPTPAPVPTAVPTVVLPIDGYGERRTFKGFGEFIIDRFEGYHAGDDIEYADAAGDVPVRAITHGRVRLSKWVSGYGGLVVVEHALDGKTYQALYGHIDLGSTRHAVGDTVSQGDVLGILGDDRTAETDGERRHLHFSIAESEPDAPVRTAGYAASPAQLAQWLNPSDFFAAHGVSIPVPERMFSPASDLGGSAFRVSFPIPSGWEVEYVPSLPALNLYTLAGSGSARERSQIFIRYFDSTRFETLSMVTVHGTADTLVGTGQYAAKRYDIEKKPGVPDFMHQPAWRNRRHHVTDFRGQEGRTRYYVVATHPDLDPATVAAFLDRITIVEE